MFAVQGSGPAVGMLTSEGEVSMIVSDSGKITGRKVPNAAPKHLLALVERTLAPCEPITHSAVSCRAAHYLRQAGIVVPRPGSHTLRHTCVQRLVDAWRVQRLDRRRQALQLAHPRLDGPGQGDVQKNQAQPGKHTDKQHRGDLGQQPLLQRRDHVPFAQLVLRATMQVNQVDVIGL